jgi:hypothetical protein
MYTSNAMRFIKSSCHTDIKSTTELPTASASGLHGW